MSRVYAPTYAVDLDALSRVWGGAKLAPVDDWPKLLTRDQRELVGWDLVGMERVLRRVADGDVTLAHELAPEAELMLHLRARVVGGGVRSVAYGPRPALDVRHALELWCGWLGRSVDFIQAHHRWMQLDSDHETLEWLVRRGVDVEVGLGRSPWPVDVASDAMLVRTIRADEVRTGLERMRELRDEVPLSMWREHRALLALYEERARETSDLVELAWF